VVRGAFFLATNCQGFGFFGSVGGPSAGAGALHPGQIQAIRDFDLPQANLECLVLAGVVANQTRHQKRLSPVQRHSPGVSRLLSFTNRRQEQNGDAMDLGDIHFHDQAS